MPKYVLDPSGNIKDLDKGDAIIVRDDIASTISAPYVKKGGSTYTEGAGEIFKSAETSLPLFSDFKDLRAHTINVTDKPVPGNDGFVKKDTGNPENNFLLNPSFGADEPQKYYKNFNDYLNNKEIFSTEIELAAGLDFNSTFGFKDITNLRFVFDYIVEAVVYIITIEAFLSIDNVLDGDEGANSAQYSQYQLGNYGQVNNTAIARYFREVLNYPSQDKRSAGVFDRLGAFFVGLGLFVNGDSQSIKFWQSKYEEKYLESRSNGFFAFLFDLVYYLLESIFSLSDIGSNRLLMLIRRFHQKGYWHKAQLYTAKDGTKENSFEKYLAQLNYYYVKFFIERMNIGLQVASYHKNKNGKYKKFLRSSRNKDSRSGQFGFEIKGNDYFAKNSKDLMLARRLKENNLEITNKKLENRSSMSNAMLPQALIMPQSLINSNDMKSNKRYQQAETLCEDLVRSYFIQTSKPQERISQEVVKQLEDHYEREMMPFYFQDLRTNEVLGFHAFIDSITDNFNVNHNPTKGFGRIEDIRHYVDTTRNVNITFTLAAMSKEDHDLMWYQINKIVSMCYPQWSKGFKNKSVDPEGKEGFEYPFTQVPTASPLIRIRLGDVLKSNYTKHAIEKIHGVGNNEQTGDKTSYHIGSGAYLLPGVYRNMKTGEYKEFFELTSIDVENITGLPKPYNGEVNKNTSTIEPDDVGFLKRLILGADEYEIDNKSIYIAHYNDNEPGKNDSANKKYTDAYSGDEKLLNNPITAAYESTLGRGLAGFITMLDVNYQDQLWETEVIGSKAPKLVKLTINFAPIHDIPPGLDADGAMRAPVYNTGRIINTIYGDVYDAVTSFGDGNNKGYISKKS
jgi:hypothetical protein